jgi:histidyl-tRNA synthetase
MSRPHPLSGYPEWLPAQRAVEQHVLDTLRRTFELHGFAGIETRAVEPLSTLLRKGEIDKEVFVVRRLHAAATASGAADAAATASGAADADDTLALHFDLTVPFARYVLENAGHLTFPFRRYQIQKAWRGERPQEGRYREFCQADIDVVDRDTLAGHHEVEVAAVMADALGRLPLPPLTMQVNNRRLIEGFYAGLGVPAADPVMRQVDKLDKIGPDAVADLLAGEVGLSPGQVSGVLALAAIAAEDASLVEQVGALGVEHPMLDQGLAELVAVLDGTRDLLSDRFRVVADLRIARGLDYYTGTVYETRMSGFESLGSVCSGGRYDALADDGRTRYPGVGLSFGVTRTLAPLLGRGLLEASRPVPTCVLVAVPSEATRGDADAVARLLRDRGIPTEVAPSAAKFGKQIRHADRLRVPYVWFPAGDGRTGEVKDIRTGHQQPADAATWAPPPHELTVEVRQT